MFRIGICDDEPLICTELERIVSGYAWHGNGEPETESFHSGQELKSRIERGHRFDLLFLDIELGDMTGLHISRMIRREMEDHMTEIVFITSKNGYEMQLFNVQPLDFLRKPLSSARVYECISLALKRLGRRNDTFSFKIKGDRYWIRVKDIIYFQGAGRRIRLISAGEEPGKEYMFYEKMDEVAERVDKSVFLRTHKNCLINGCHIANKKAASCEIEMTNGHVISYHKRKSREINEFLDAFGGGV